MVIIVVVTWEQLEHAQRAGLTLIVHGIDGVEVSRIQWLRAVNALCIFPKKKSIFSEKKIQSMPEGGYSLYSTEFTTQTVCLCVSVCVSVCV